MPCLRPKGRGKGKQQDTPGGKQHHLLWGLRKFNCPRCQGKRARIGGREASGRNRPSQFPPPSARKGNLFTLQCLAANMAAPAPFKSEVFTPHQAHRVTASSPVSPAQHQHGPCSLNTGKATHPHFTTSTSAQPPASPFSSPARGSAHADTEQKAFPS